MKVAAMEGRSGRDDRWAVFMARSPKILRWGEEVLMPAVVDGTALVADDWNAVV